MNRSLAVAIGGIWAVLLILGCSRQHGATGADCRIDKDPCVKTIMPGSITAVFDIRPKPVKMMSSLSFHLSLAKGDGPVTDADVNLYLTMPGMYMGEHKVIMNHQGKGHYEGSSVIPRCPSGKKVWKAEVVIEGSHSLPSKYITIDYTFEVKE